MHYSIKIQNPKLVFHITVDLKLPFGILGSFSIAVVAYSRNGKCEFLLRYELSLGYMASYCSYVPLENH